MTGRETDFLVGVMVPVTTVCPCSKEISDLGAHNQRSIVKVNVRFKKFFWIEDVVKLSRNRRAPTSTRFSRGWTKSM